MTERNETGPTSSPATRLLDALGRGDLEAMLLEFRPTTIVRTEDHTWSVQGEDQVILWLEDAFNRFPGLVFDSHARHIGYGQVIEEARVRDVGPADHPGSPSAEAAGQATGDGPGPAGSHSAALVLDREQDDVPRLNMPVRLTVLHDDRSVHEIVTSYPRALLRSALGLHVDPLDMAVSEIQSAFVAPSGSGFRTYRLGGQPGEVVPVPITAPPPTEIRVREPVPEPEVRPSPVAAVPIEELLAAAGAAAAPPLAPPLAPPPEVPRADGADSLRRRAILVAPVVVVLVVAVVATTWLLGRGNDAADRADGKGRQPGHSASQPVKADPKPTNGASASTRAKPPPKPVITKPNKPTVTLKSDLAFAKNSSALSHAAKVAVSHLATQIRAAGVRGTIYINGYTDNLGSDAHGLELSQDRASAVAQHLRGALHGYQITIVAVGHGESNPIASNATEAGRQQNRRVTITLPRD